jgi:anaerobic ribonucleoside-triphosphate reductase
LTNLNNDLLQSQVDSKVAFIKHYVDAKNAATGSIVDPNSNVTTKNISTLEAELYKYETIQLNRAIVTDILRKDFGESYATQYLNDIHNHLIYVHDETTLKPYCASITLYPFLFDGSETIGGTSAAPKNIKSFCGSLVNLLYQISGGFAGAVATVEFLMYFDYFAKKTWGDDYLITHRKDTEQELQGVIYSLNQPASARGYQSIFWNISIFDKYYFESLFGEFVFPDGSKPNYKSLDKLQAFFMEWFRLERRKKLLTFPVITAAYLVDKETKTPKDKEFVALLADQMSKGHSFFHYESTSADSLASCCRLRNELADNTFSYTLGAGGVSTGSVQVITINFNRMIQQHDELVDVVKRVQVYLMAHRKWQVYMRDKGMLPAYSAGFIDMDKQFLTVGVNGVLESYEFLSHTNATFYTYEQYLKTSLEIIKELNKDALKEYGIRFNTEFVPAENLGVKNAKWDKEDNLYVKRDCYNSYFYPVEDAEWNIMDKIEIHGENVAQYLDGGAALHLNISRIPSYAEAMKLIELTAKYGVPYWTFNVLCTVCGDCGHISPNNYDHCPKCNSKNVQHGTRVIGYLKLISSFSEGRQKEASRRNYCGIKLDETYYNIAKERIGETK